MRVAKPVLKTTLLLSVLAPLYVTSAGADTLSLNYERTSLGTTTYSSSATSAAGTYNYGHTVAHTDGNVSGTNYGFYDDYIFTIAAGNVDSVTSTIDLAGVYGINNFQVRLFSVADALTPGATGYPGSAPIPGWTQAYDCTTGSISCTGTVSIIAPYSLTAGTYDLQIRGTTEVGGGSYAGVLNVTPVPLPAAFPLLMSGMGLLGGIARRRS